MKEMTSFATWNLLGAASGMISQYGLSIVLNSFFGTVLNAAQGIANQISGQLMVFSNTMMKAVNPVIAKSEGGGKRDLMLQVSTLGSKFSFLLLALFAVPFIIETKYIFQVWLKIIPDWAIIFTRLQLCRSLVEQLTVMFGSAIAAHGSIKKFTLLKSILNISPICFTFLGFAYGYPPYILYIFWILFGGIIGGGLTLYFINNLFGISYLEFFKDIVKPCMLISMLMFMMGILPLIILEDSILRLTIVVTMTTTTFFLSYYFIFSTNNERFFLNKALSKFKNRFFTL